MDGWGEGLVGLVSLGSNYHFLRGGDSCFGLYTLFIFFLVFIKDITSLWSSSLVIWI